MPRRALRMQNRPMPAPATLASAIPSARRCAALLRAQGVAVARVRPVARLDCEIWRVETTDGADLALRIYPQRKTERGAIEAEVAWLQAAADEGLHVPRPLPDASGRLLRTWQPEA